LKNNGAEVLRTGRRCISFLHGERLVGMMNVHMLNSVPRGRVGSDSVQSAMIPREAYPSGLPGGTSLRLLERLLAADINQMPVVSGAENGGSHVVGMITRDSSCVSCRTGQSWARSLGR